jgi:hypothetical protein
MENCIRNQPPKRQESKWTIQAAGRKSAINSDHQLLPAEVSLYWLVGIRLAWSVLQLSLLGFLASWRLNRLILRALAVNRPCAR